MVNCYICNVFQNNINVTRSIFRHEYALDVNLNRMNISRLHRERHRHALEALNADSRLCLNCDERVVKVLRFQNDPRAIQLEVLVKAGGNSCVLCQEATAHRISFDTRVYFYRKTNIYIPSGSRCCPNHVINDVIDEVLLHQEFTSIPMKLPLQGNVASRWFMALAQKSIEDRYDNENNFSNDDFYTITGVAKYNFREMFQHCEPVVLEDGSRRIIKKKYLIAFLAKLRQGLSDELIKTIMSFSSRPTVSMWIDLTSKSLDENWAVLNVGLNSPPVRNREAFIQGHNNDFVNALYNPQPQERHAILYLDCTYFEIHKSSNFVVQRQSFSLHKRYNLVKASLIVASDGFILDVLGPCFCDSRNIDSEIFRNTVENDAGRLIGWLQDGDIFVVDRGYRDSIELLEQLNLNYEIPPFLPRGQRQFTTAEANRSRLITKTRWTIESRNGHIKTIFKFFANSISIPNAPRIGRYLRIACAIINAYHPPITMEGFNANTAFEMRNWTLQENHLQQRVFAENLLRRGGVRINIDDNNLIFPRLPIEYLVSKTFGTYQVKLAPAYIQDKKRRQDGFEVHQIDPNLIRVRIFSRHVNANQHTCFIQYHHEINDNIRDPIVGTYCTCKVGAKTLGVCAHAASIIWYLSHGRYPENNAQYPSNNLITVVLDAAHRHDENNED